MELYRVQYSKCGRAIKTENCWGSISGNIVDVELWFNWFFLYWSNKWCRNGVGTALCLCRHKIGTGTSYAGTDAWQRRGLTGSFPPPSRSLSVYFYWRSWKSADLHVSEVDSSGMSCITLSCAAQVRALGLTFASANAAEVGSVSVCVFVLCVPGLSRFYEFLRFQKVISVVPEVLLTCALYCFPAYVAFISVMNNLKTGTLPSSGQGEKLWHSFQHVFFYWVIYLLHVFSPHKCMKYYVY